ncbi:DUF554 domain-containing protein [Metaclostridioides mangenotii]|jgi:uncharacterized membrane protein YqgA involved in biofilm formation|uniref:Membrane protein YqgA involved in biofilm formation n=1 Tax=Metaclostridioides mangenotii TaxID=1540 RepID=A0ABS4E7S8_9FIRM|nr:DUF554 domain-containing protein [Clostridioides mangenotii]MBP1853991.1 putative membrane protein YqgA involved in biofilm formation [Clostridioides mangenotii]
MLGTIVNSLAIAVGCIVGLFIKKGIPDRVSKTIMSGLGLCVLYIGIEGSLKGENTLITVICIAVGGLIGELIDIDKKINKLGDFLQEKFSKGDDQETSIAKGFVTTSLIYCVGAMAIVGALESGLTGNHQTLFTKALLDGISAIIFTTTLGIGVIFSSVAVFIYQGLITIGAAFLSTLLSDAVVTALTAVGSLLIIGIALNLLEITKIKVANLLPAVFLPILFGLINLL